MSKHSSELEYEQEVAAQGADIYRAPGEDHLIEETEEGAQGHGRYRAPGARRFLDEAREAAVASGWISDDTLAFPSSASRDGVINRRQELYDAMRELESAVARPSGMADWRISIEAALTRLETALASHVARIEGEDGLFAELRAHSPHLDSRIESLRREHEDLASTSHQAISMAADWDPGTLRRKVNLLLARLAIHRQTGSELLFDAYNVDLAAAN